MNGKNVPLRAEEDLGRLMDLEAACSLQMDPRALYDEYKLRFARMQNGESGAPGAEPAQRAATDLARALRLAPGGGACRPDACSGGAQIQEEV